MFSNAAKSTAAATVERVLSAEYLGKHAVSAVKNYIFDGQAIMCCFCNKPLTRKTATIEHIIPKSEACYEIRNHIDNMAISCAKCNHERITADFTEFRRYVQGITDEPPVGCKTYIRRERIAKVSAFVSDIVDMFVSGSTIMAIGEHFHMSNKTVKRVLRENDLVPTVSIHSTCTIEEQHV